MVRNIVGGSARQAGGTTDASRRTVWIGHRQIEAAHERSPDNARSAEQVSDVGSSHLQLVARGIGADITNRVGIVDESKRAIGRHPLHRLSGSASLRRRSSGQKSG